MRIDLSTALALTLALAAPPAWAQLEQAKDVLPELEPGPSQSWQGRRGNVLILLADDIGIDMVGAYGAGSDLAPTPVIDSLAAEGVRFNNAWANPVCSPTRATIQTGRYSIRTGMGWIAEPWVIGTFLELEGLPLSEMILPEMLDQGTGDAYSHAAFGKWHLGMETELGGAFAPNLAGYDHFAGVRGNIPDYYAYDRIEDGVAVPSTKYATVDTVDSALAWLETAEEPWFCYVAFNAGHDPYQAPPAELHSIDLTGASEQNARPFYKAMVEAMDTEIGRLLDGLGEERERTTILFIGDNGTPVFQTLPPFVPDHAKGTVYEGGLNVPFIVAGKHVSAKGTESDALVNTTDVFATVADLAQVDLKSVVPRSTRLDSISILPYLEDPQRPSEREFLYAETFLPHGPGAGQPLVQPPYVPCESDIGFQGPGTAVLTLCGGPLTAGNAGSLQVTGAPPNATAVLIEGLSFNPTPMLGGTIAGWPSFAETVYQTDSLGELVVPGITTPGVELTVYMQVAIADGTQPSGFSITNSLQVDYLPRNWKAIRNERYKLLWAVNGGPQEFYDLEVDPFESNDLLLGSMNAAETQAYDELLGRMKRLMAGA